MGKTVWRTKMISAGKAKMYLCNWVLHLYYNKSLKWCESCTSSPSHGHNYHYDDFQGHVNTMVSTCTQPCMHWLSWLQNSNERYRHQCSYGRVGALLRPYTLINLLWVDILSNKFRQNGLSKEVQRQKLRSRTFDIIIVLRIIISFA